MVDTTELTGLISALRAETEADSVSPERVGYVLQQIVNFLPSLDSSGLTSDVATALATAQQALSAAQSATSTAQTAQTAATSAQNVANAASSTANAASTLASQCESAVTALTTLVGQLQTALEPLSDGIKTDEVKYDSNILDFGEDEPEKGYIWALNVSVNSKVTNHVSSNINPAWGCFRVLVKAGDIIHLHSTGSTGNYRAWVLTDVDGRVLEMSAPVNSATVQDATIEVRQDGRLYGNHKDDGSSVFSLTVYHRLKDRVEAIGEEVAAVHDELYITETHGPAELISGYWHLTRSAPSSHVPPQRNQSSSWKSFSCAVKAGEHWLVSTKGGNDAARAWGLTDTDRNYLTKAASGTDTRENPVLLEVTEDGYLFVNCATDPEAVPAEDYTAQFFAVKRTALKEVVSSGSMKPKIPTYRNNPLPLWKDSLRVLAIGNSFVKDSLSYLGSLVEASGISEANLCVYGLVVGGSNPQTIVNYYNNNTSVTSNVARWAGTLQLASPIGEDNTLAEVLAHEWDVVVINGYSKWEWADYGSSVTELVKIVRSCCPNQQVALAWHSVWSYASYEDTGYENSDMQWAALCEVTKAQMGEVGIDIVIPSGTAVQNARKTTIAAAHIGKDDPTRAGELTRDGAHMCFGAGRYLAACTWFQSLLSPMFSIGVVGNSAVHAVSLADHLWRIAYTKVKDSDKQGKNPSSQGWYERIRSVWDEGHPEESYYYQLSSDTSAQSGTDYYTRSAEGGDDDASGNDTNEVVDVDAEKALILQRCALAACVDMWNITIQSQQE